MIGVMARRQVSVGGKDVWVDSLLEERMLRWFEDHGFAGRWERPAKGLNSGIRNYTPDVYLYIELKGKMHRAIVEIKSVLRDKRYGFTKEIFGRMHVAASVYLDTVLLLYVDKTETWYRIDSKTGTLSEFGVPVPAEKTIDHAYKPITIKARSVGNHRYGRRLDHYIADKFANTLESGVQAIFGVKKAKPKRKPKPKNKSSSCLF